jgi:four helix bundle protein
LRYRKLQVWELAAKCVLEIHKMSLELPAFEKYETGSQIRRSSKSIKSNIVEGYGRRMYPKEYVRFLVYAQASNDETIDHLETLFSCGSLTDEEKYNAILNSLTLLGRKINLFIQVLQKHKANNQQPATSNQQPATSN